MDVTQQSRMHASTRDISERHGDLLKAVEHWKAARPLFERSSQQGSDYTGDAEYQILLQPSNLEATKDKEVVDELTAPSTTKATNSHQVTISSFKATSPYSQAASTPPILDFNQAEEIKTGTFAICSPHDEKREPETQYVSFTAKDLTYSQANLGVGGCLISIHEPAEAALWIEDNWDDRLLTFIRHSGCSGPFAWMLSPAEPALAIFGNFEDPIIVNMADSLADLSGFPVVIRPSSDNPALTLLSRETDPQNGFIQFGRAASNDEETRSDGDDEANTFGNENTPGDSGDGGQRDDDLDRAGPDNHGLNVVDEYKRRCGYKGGQEAGDGDGDGGGPTSMDDKWESQLHRTRVKLRLKLNAVHTYAVTIGYTFKLTINRETEIPIDRKDITRPLSQPEVIAFVDFKIETRPRETQVDRSYATCIEGLISQTNFTNTGNTSKFSGELKLLLDFPKEVRWQLQLCPIIRTMMPYWKSLTAKCRVDYETGDEWDEGNKSYSSYNIAYQPQGMHLDAKRSEFYPLEVRSYLDNIQTEEKLTINEQEEIDLEAGPLKKPQTKQEQHEPGTISLSIARVQNQSPTGSNKFGAVVPAFIAKLGQRSSAAPPTYIPPDEYLARGWDVHNNEWRSVLWPALDKQFRAAALERTSPVWNIRCQWKQAQQAIAANIQP
ncbi:hypothetical protein B0H13DRAFT_1902087 [Mycena leptocephala]|nr:hypothetical protein B0H13DRAFT_1902087 [Mycena leptocephala]